MTRMFSSTRVARRVPGIGTEVTPNPSARCRSQASATCAAVALCSSATDLTMSTTARLVSSAPSLKRGIVRRKSLGDERSAAERTVPVRKPRPAASRARTRRQARQPSAPHCAPRLGSRSTTRSARRRRGALRGPRAAPARSPRTVRDGAPCRPSPVRPSRRQFPRSARSGRGGA